MNDNIGSTGGAEGGESGLQHVVNEVKKGLPNVDEMRAVVEKGREEEFRANLAKKLSEYEALFGKFKSGTATDQETSRMGDLLTELETMRKNLGLGGR